RRAGLHSIPITDEPLQLVECGLLFLQELRGDRSGQRTIPFVGAGATKAVKLLGGLFETLGQRSDEPILLLQLALYRAGRGRRFERGGGCPARGFRRRRRVSRIPSHDRVYLVLRWRIGG